MANKRILALNSTEFAEMEQRPIQISGRIQKEFIGISSITPDCLNGQRGIHQKNVYLQ